MLLESAIGGLVGAVTGLVTKWFDIKDKEKDRDHEYRMTQLQIQIDASRAQQENERIITEGEVQESIKQWEAMKEAIAVQNTLVGNKWIDGINSLVRPLITFWWCIILYTVYKLTLITVAYSNKSSLQEFATLIVSEFDGAVISAIISFWFVSRQLMKYSANARG